MIPIKEWAHIKAASNAQLESDWLKVLEGLQRSFKQNDLDMPVLERIFFCCETPEKFTVMIRLFYQYARSQAQGKKGFSHFMNYVDASPFPLVQWVEALNYFYGWLESHQRKIDFVRMLGYLECCTNAKQTPEIHRPLISVLKEMLDRWGVEERK